MGENDRQHRAREASHQYFTEALARMYEPDRNNRTLAASSICGMRVALAGPTLADIDRALGLPVKSKD